MPCPTGCQQSARHRPCAEDREKILRHTGRAQLFVSLQTREVHGLRPRGRPLLHRLKPLYALPQWTRVRQIAVLHLDKTVRGRVRQRSQHHVVHQREDRRHAPYTETQQQHCAANKSRTAHETPRAMRENLHQSLHGRVMELQPDPFAVMEAAGALYEIDALQPGQDAPDFSAVTIDGETIRLTGFRGRIVLLDFWATDCGPCWPEFPHLRTLHTSLPESDFSLIGVSQDHDEELLREVLEQENLLWPRIREPTQWRDRVPIFGAVSKLYNVWGIPRTVLIDREGIILAKDLRGDVLVNAVRERLAP